MTKAWKSLFGLVAGGLLAALLTACGDGGGGTNSVSAAAVPAPAATLAGTFTDAPVVGAKYYTSSGSGGCVAGAPCATGTQGEFSYASGDTVAFSAAGVTLGTTPILQPSTDGSTTVTPVSLVSGATAPTDPGPTAIAQFLQTLSTLAAGTSGSGAPGVLTMPTDAATTGKLSTALGSAGVTAATSVATVVTKMQAAMDTAFGVNQFTVVPASTATAALTQGVNGNGIIGTVWSGTCTCGGGGTIYFQPDGTLTGFTDTGKLLAGSWVGSTTAGGGVTVQISSSEGGRGTGSIPINSSTGTATVYNSSGVLQGTFTFTKIAASGTGTATNTHYIGGWYATYTPNATAIANRDNGGTAYFIAAPNGTFYGVTDGSSDSFHGTWSPANGQGTATWTDSQCTQNCTTTISIDLASANGTVSQSGQAAGTLALSRTGTLTRKTNQNNTAAPIPLLLSVTVSWANNSGSNTVTSLALGLNVFNSSGALVSSTVRSESTAPRFDGIRTTITDNIAVPYPTGIGATYRLSVGGANCTIDGGSGTINDTNSGKPAAYPTVNVTCDPNSTVQTIPLLLNVSTTWGTTFPKGSMPGYGLALAVKDASGHQVAGGFVQQTQTMSGASFTVTNNIAASYPRGSGVTYALTTGSAYCSITGGGSGTVNDANMSNAAAYPTVTVTCP